MKQLGVIGIALLMALSTFGQDTKRYLKLANTDFSKDYFRLAAINYERVLSKEPDNNFVIYRLGICYLHTYSNKKGLEFLLKALENDPDVDRHLEYWLGRGFHLNYKFADASQHYSEYLTSLGKKDGRRASINKLIEECTYGKQYLNDPKNYSIINAGPVLNTEYSEHSPVITQDGATIFFTSEQFVDTEDEADRVGQLYEDIYVSEKNNKGEWEPPVPFMRNTDEQDATIQLFDNDSKLLIYSSKGAGDLYYTEVNAEDHWSDLKEFEGVNSFWPEVDAYISADQSFMVIASSREDHGEDHDLYFAKKVGDKWGELEKLPDYINTGYDENSPFISADGKYLFFSSNGHTTMGGYDVFRCEIDLEFGTWGEPQNMGYPLNTPGDDIYFYYTNDNSWSGYFSSYREGGYGEKDLYLVTFIPNVFVSGVVTDFEGGLPVAGLRVEFHSEKKGDILSDAITSTPEGRYRVNILADDSYAVRVLDENDKILSSAHYEIGTLSSTDPLEYQFDIKVDLSSEEPLIADAGAAGDVQHGEDQMDAAPGDNEPDEELVYDIENPDENGVETQSSSSEIDFSASFANADDNTSNARTSNSRLEFNGQTEESENSEANMTQSSVESVESSIEESENNEAIVSSTNPTAEPSTSTSSGTSSRATNNTQIAETSAPSDRGYDEDLAPLDAATQQAFFQKVKDAEQKWDLTHQETAAAPIPVRNQASPSDRTQDTPAEDAKEYFNINKLEEGCTGVLSNVYFDFNRASIKSNSYDELDQLVCLMTQNPGIKVEIGGHTDNVGGEGYNENLSLKRANSVVKYLVRKGIKKQRLVAVGYGENNPLASNDDEMEGRELNRRTEFKVVETGVVFATH